MFDTDNAGAVPEAQPPKKRRERKAAAKIKPPKKTAKKAKKAPAKKAKTAKKKRQTIAVSGGVAKMGLRPGSKLALISDLLARPGGCTRADVMKACKWPSVSMPQQASALGRELVTDKKPGEPTRYTLKPL